jgi:hypothetical protein
MPGDQDEEAQVLSDQPGLANFLASTPRGGGFSRSLPTYDARLTGPVGVGRILPQSRHQCGQGRFLSDGLTGSKVQAMRRVGHQQLA